MKLRNPDRIPYVLAEIEKMWKTKPDLRLGQLLWIMAGGDPFGTEDYTLLHRGAANLNYPINTPTLPEYWIEPNAFKELIEELNKK